MKKPWLDWPAIRAAFETEVVTQREIGERFGLSPRAIRDRAAKGGWIRCAAAVGPRYRGSVPSARPRLARPLLSPARAPRRMASDTASSRAMILALQRTTARLVEAAELQFTGEAGDGAAESAAPTTIDEKDLRMLGALAAMLAKVIALDASPRRPRDDDPAAFAPDGHSATGTKIDFDDPQQRDAFSERLERYAAERAAGDAVAADGVGAPDA
jgi:hypothetical protein